MKAKDQPQKTTIQELSAHESVTPGESVEAEKSDPSLVPWGIVAAILGGFALFIVPQVLVGLALVVFALSSGRDVEALLSNDSIGFTFGLYGAAELATVVSLWLFLRYKNYSLKQFGLSLTGLKYGCEHGSCHRVLHFFLLLVDEI